MRSGGTKNQTKNIDEEALRGRVDSALARLGSLVQRDAQWLEVDLTMGQLKALFVLMRQGAVAVGALARCLGIGEPAASLLVDKLEDRGLARRESDPNDRRRTLVVLRESGLELLGQLRATRDDRFAGWLRLMEDDDLRMLLAGLEALLRAAEAGDASEDERNDG